MNIEDKQLQAAAMFELRESFQEFVEERGREPTVEELKQYQLDKFAWEREQGIEQMLDEFIPLLDSFHDDGIARLYRAVFNQAYDRKLTHDWMLEVGE